nr:ABC transporter permease [Armatimonadota bacterium]
MFDRLEFVFSEAVTALKRNGLMTLSAINTAAIALFILGGLGYAYLNLSAKLESLPPQFEIKISVKPKADKEQVAAMTKSLRKVIGVAQVSLLPKDVEWQAWRRSQGILGDTRDIKNPLPDQLVITLTDLKKAEHVRDAIRKQPFYDGRDGIRDAIELRQRVTSMIEFVRWAGIIFGLIAFFTAGSLILNAVHLTVLARRQEIKIMRLVGASHGTIRWPFLFEGAFQGILGGVLAGLLLWGLAAYLTARSIKLLGPLLSTDMQFPAVPMIGILAGVGAI